MTRTMFVRVAVAAVLAISLSAGGAYAVTCTVDAGAICPYGYKITAVIADLAKDASIENCCIQDEAVVSFPACKAPVSGGTTAIQAPTSEDTSWLVQDGSGYTRTVGRYTGMCFTVLVDNNDCDAVANPACCTAKRPAYVQFKINADMHLAATSTAKCRLSYGTGIANANSLKRITSWAAAGTGKYVNLPLTWKKNAKTTTVCVYSVYSASATNECDLETICGVGAVPTAPDEDGNYAADGCELRIVGRKTAASSACCTPTFAVEAFDSTVENRLADGAPATATIELHGV